MHSPGSKQVKLKTLWMKKDTKIVAFLIINDDYPFKADKRAVVKEKIS